MDGPTVAAIIGSVGLLIGGIVGVFVKRGTDKQANALGREQSAYDQAQEDAENARKEAAAARKEANEARELLAAEGKRYRDATNDLWVQIEKMNTAMDEMRRQHRQDIADDEAYIQSLIHHINERREPPAPARAKVIRP